MSAHNGPAEPPITELALSDSVIKPDIEALQGGLSAHQAAEQFAIGHSTALLRVRRFRECGERGPRKMGKPPGSRLHPHAEYLLSLLEQPPPGPDAG